MTVIRNIFFGLVGLLTLAIVGIYATGNGMLLTILWATTMGGPDLPFDDSKPVDAPNYADPSNWAALPDREGVEDMIPVDTDDTDIQGNASVDVFFVHPTGFLRGKEWIYSMDQNTATEENTKWMMANQASPFNGCCNIYAPRYRQANIFAFFQEESVRDEILGFAYQDVERSFEYFIDNYSEGRPFILASHSQGTYHSVRLLQEQIDKTDLYDRLVAAYVIGGNAKVSSFEKMEKVYLCNSADDVGCAVHWDTWSESVIDSNSTDSIGNVCTNPLTWELDGGLAEKSLHKGAVVSSGVFQTELSGPDVATGVDFKPLGAPIASALRAQCKNGSLFISDQSDTPFGEQGGSFGGGNYHGLDYPVFHMDIRQNAKVRAEAFFKRET